MKLKILLCAWLHTIELYGIKTQVTADEINLCIYIFMHGEA